MPFDKTRPTIEDEDLGHSLHGDNSASTADPTSQEALLWCGRTHWKHYIGRIALWGVANIAGIYFAWGSGHLGTILLIVFLISSVLLLGPAAWSILSRRYRLTTQRLFIERGILSQTIDQTELIRVDDVRIRKSLADRILGLGTVEIMSTDATDSSIDIVGILGPERVAEGIRSNVRTMRKKSLFVETL